MIAELNQNFLPYVKMGDEEIWAESLDKGVLGVSLVTDHH